MATTFALNIDRWVEKAKGRGDLVVRKLSLDLLSRIVLRSPVDTGRFRGHWDVGINHWPEGLTGRRDPNGAATIGAGSAIIAQVKAGDVVYLANNLPYGPALERGHSKQAPSGIVGVTVAEFNQAVGSAVQAAKREVP